MPKASRRRPLAGADEKRLAGVAATKEATQVARQVDSDEHRTRSRFRAFHPKVRARRA
jgi:hypothetical protein